MRMKGHITGSACGAACACRLLRLSTIYPDTLMLGMEIRDKVAAYVRERIGT